MENQEKHVKHMQKTMGTKLRVLLWVGRKDLPSLPTTVRSSSVIQHAETPTWHIKMKGDGEDKGEANLNPNPIHIFTPSTSIWRAFLS